LNGHKNLKNQLKNRMDYNLTSKVADL